MYWVAFVLCWLMAIGGLLAVVVFLQALAKGKTSVDVDASTLGCLARWKDRRSSARRASLLALGFAPVGSTREYWNFDLPFRFRWAMRGHVYWFVSPDGGTFVGACRASEHDNDTLAAVTLFEKEGSWTTMFPGWARPPRRNHGVGGASAGEPSALLAEHAAYVARFQHECGLDPKTGSLADLAPVALSWKP